MKSLILKYKSIITYGLVSVFTAIIEIAVGWCIIKIFDTDIVLSNTIAVILSAFLHYILTSKAVFKVKNDLKSFLIYVLTFFVGMALQNLVIWIFYQLLFGGDENFAVYVISKGMSLVIPFAVTYYLRKIINNKFANGED